MGAFTKPLRSIFTKPLRKPFDPGTTTTPIQRAIALLRRFGTTSDLRINAVSDNTVTSTGAVTIADGGGVEVLDTKIWRIV